MMSEIGIATTAGIEIHAVESREDFLPSFSKIVTVPENRESSSDPFMFEGRIITM